jgi:4-hydroxy-tetrahydrodipicolinate reductase
MNPPNDKLAIVGYGKMGKLIERLAPEYGFAVALRLDSRTNIDTSAITAENFEGIETAIEFSTPTAAPANIASLAALGVNVVSGTTGWTAHAEKVAKVRAAVAQHGIALVSSSNFSIGVQIFLKLAACAGSLFAHQSDYEAWAWEIHHSAKKDAPSGTLLTLVDRAKKAGYARAIDQSSSRAGAHPGTHELGFDSAADTITIRHTARNREGFGRGALRVAQWIRGKRGVFEFSDIIGELNGSPDSRNEGARHV